MHRAPWIAALVLCFAPACETTSRTLPPQADFDLTRAAATRRWDVFVQAERVGEVVRFDDVEGPRFFYSVRNTLHQELGLIDARGRTYRYKAHQPEPDWIGTMTVLEGVEKILGCEARPELRERELAPSTADESRS